MAHVPTGKASVLEPDDAIQGLSQASHSGCMTARRHGHYSIWTCLCGLLQTSHRRDPECHNNATVRACSTASGPLCCHIDDKPGASTSSKAGECLQPANFGAMCSTTDLCADLHGVGENSIRIQESQSISDRHGAARSTILCKGGSSSCRNGCSPWDAAVLVHCKSHQIFV